MAKRVYDRANFDLPAVDVPDWQLVEPLVELLRKYCDASNFRVTARDARGSYWDDSLDALRAEAAQRDQEPESIEIGGGAEEEGTETVRELTVAIESTLSSKAFFSSGDEAIVDHLDIRTRALFEAAAAGRQQRLAVEANVPPPVADPPVASATPAEAAPLCQSLV